MVGHTWLERVATVQISLDHHCHVVVIDAAFENYLVHFFVINKSIQSANYSASFLCVA